MTPNEKALRDAIERAKSLSGDELVKAVAEVEAVKADVEHERELRKEFAGMGEQGAAPSSLKAALEAAGIDGIKGVGGVIDARAFGIGLKGDVVATESTAAPTRLPGVAGLGVDRRSVTGSIASSLIPYAGVPTRIDYLRQSARAYPVAGTATLALDHATDKPATTVTVVEAQAATKVFGTVSDSQPNALLGHDGLTAIIQAELRQVLREEVELHIVTTLLADANKATATQGTDTLTDAIYKAANALKDSGFSASFVAMAPSVAEQIYLQKTADDAYMREIGAPLFGMPIVETNQLDATSVMIMDASAARFHGSQVAIAFDPYSGFAANRTTVRAELYGAAVVNQGAGIMDLTIN